MPRSASPKQVRDRVVSYPFRPLLHLAPPDGQAHLLFAGPAPAGTGTGDGAADHDGLPGPAAGTPAPFPATPAPDGPGREEPRLPDLFLCLQRQAGPRGAARHPVRRRRQAADGPCHDRPAGRHFPVDGGRRRLLDLCPERRGTCCWTSAVPSCWACAPWRGRWTRGACAFCAAVTGQRGHWRACAAGWTSPCVRDGRPCC